MFLFRPYTPDHELLPAVDALFCHAPDRRPASYWLSRRFATSPSNPCAFTDSNEDGQTDVQWRGVSDWFTELRQDLLLQEVSAHLKWLAHHVATGKDHHVEHEVQDRRF
jgi:hypothetical protein